MGKRSIEDLSKDKAIRDSAFDDIEQGKQTDLVKKRKRNFSPLVSKVVRCGVPQQSKIHPYKYSDKLSPPIRSDDKDGHYVFESGDNLTSRYKILSKIGEGTFGRVLECWDRKEKDLVAIKIIRNVPKYRHAAMIELSVLDTVAQNDPRSKWHCVKLREWFDYRNHICMVFRKYGYSLFDFLKKNSFRPFSLSIVKHFSLQLLQAVAYLHDITLIHTDLKPENILLLDDNYKKVDHDSKIRYGRRIPTSSEIKVIDFGSATFDDQYHSHIVSTRHYRAPEIILGIGWSYQCDVWSIGCILVELLTGQPLFQTHENLEHLAMMERVLGPIPYKMVQKADEQSKRYFRSSGRLNWPEGAQDRRSIRAVKQLQKLDDYIRELADTQVEYEIKELSDLLYSMMRHDPEERISAREAATHKFFTSVLSLEDKKQMEKQLQRTQQPEKQQNTKPHGQQENGLTKHDSDEYNRTVSKAKQHKSKHIAQQAPIEVQQSKQQQKQQLDDIQVNSVQKQKDQDRPQSPTNNNSQKQIQKQDSFSKRDQNIQRTILKQDSFSKRERDGVSKKESIQKQKLQEQSKSQSKQSPKSQAKYDSKFQIQKQKSNNSGSQQENQSSQTKDDICS